MISSQLEKPMQVRAVTKSQWVRLVDVFWIGPLMIYGSGKIKNKFHASTLLIFGISTIVYNARNYLENQKRLQAQQTNIIEAKFKHL